MVFVNIIVFVFAVVSATVLVVFHNVFALGLLAAFLFCGHEATFPWKPLARRMQDSFPELRVIICSSAGATFSWLLQVLWAIAEVVGVCMDRVMVAVGFFVSAMYTKFFRRARTTPHFVLVTARKVRWSSDRIVFTPVKTAPKKDYETIKRRFLADFRLVHSMACVNMSSRYAGRSGRLNVVEKKGPALMDLNIGSFVTDTTVGGISQSGLAIDGGGGAEVAVEDGDGPVVGGGDEAPVDVEGGDGGVINAAVEGGDDAQGVQTDTDDSAGEEEANEHADGATVGADDQEVVNGGICSAASRPESTGPALAPEGVGSLIQWGSVAAILVVVAAFGIRAAWQRRR